MKTLQVLDLVTSDRNLQDRSKEKATNIISSAPFAVSWVYHQHPEKQNPSQWEVRLFWKWLVVSVSLLAVQALEISSYALSGQLRISYAPPGMLLQMLSSQPIKIWSQVQWSQCEFSRRSCLGTGCSLSLTFWARVSCMLIWQPQLPTKHKTTTYLLKQASDLGVL